MLIPLTKLDSGIQRQLYWLRETGGSKRVLNPRALSNTIEGNPPNPGPGLEYIPLFREDVIPDYDPRFTTLVTTEGPNAEASQIQITYSAPDKAAEEVKGAIDNAKRLELQKHFPIPEQIESLTIVVAALARQSKSLELTADEKASVESLVSIASKLTLNAAIAEDLKAQVDLGNKPDIDAAWAAKA